MSSQIRPAGQNVKPIVAHVPIERRLFVRDRRAIWRGSRRDVDWIKHFEDGALNRRHASQAAPALPLSVS